jgi:hypothetical protein
VVTGSPVVGSTVVGSTVVDVARRLVRAGADRAIGIDVPVAVGSTIVVPVESVSFLSSPQAARVTANMEVKIQGEVRIGQVLVGLPRQSNAATTKSDRSRNAPSLWMFPAGVMRLNNPRFGAR